MKVFDTNGNEIKIFKGDKGLYLLSPEFAIVDKESTIALGNIHVLKEIKKFKDKRGKFVKVIKFIDTGKNFCVEKIGKHTIGLKAIKGEMVCQVCEKPIDLSPYYVYARVPYVNQDWLDGKPIDNEPWNALKKEIITISTHDKEKHGLTPHSDGPMQTTFSEIFYKGKVNIGNPVFEHLLKTGKITPQDVHKIIDIVKEKIKEKLRESEEKSSKDFKFPSIGEMCMISILYDNWLEKLFLKDPSQKSK